MPMSASAADIGTTTVTGEVLGPIINSIDPVSGVQGETLTTVTIIGSSFTGATSVTFSGTGVTASALRDISDTSLTVTVTITAGAAAGARNIVVTTPDGPYTLTSGFTVNEAPYITVSAPAGFSLGTMARGAYTPSTVQHGSVDTNAPGWHITATGSTSNGGHMNNGSTSLASTLQISKDGTWIGAEDTLTYNQGDLTGTTFDFYARQWINATDPAGTYTITITFTGSPQ